mmetsp:Transcript_11134/g.11155  ORF Transcript_11134/g.11155 Transcript_11134/m.11155 type:complete len:136 (-) Transcript_11134:56-463(-)
MGFTRFVEVGRVALINYGPDVGKLCTIVDIVDAKRVLIDGPQSITGVHRQVIGTKRLSLTDIVVSGLIRGAESKSLSTGWKEQDTQANWEKTAWAKKLDMKKRRLALTDFDRFKLMIAKKQKSKIVSEQISKMSA